MTFVTFDIHITFGMYGGIKIYSRKNIRLPEDILESDGRDSHVKINKMFFVKDNSKTLFPRFFKTISCMSTLFRLCQFILATWTSNILKKIENQ